MHIPRPPGLLSPPKSSRYGITLLQILLSINEYITTLWLGNGMFS